MTERHRRFDVAVVGAGLVGSAIARELAGTHLRSRWSRPATTSATAPARPTPRSCTPGSTPSPAPWSPGWSPAATTSSAATPSGPASRSSAPVPSSSPGPRRSSPALPGPAGRRPRRTATTRARLVDADEVYGAVPDLGDGALGGLTVPGRVDHLHVDDQPRPGHRRGTARRRPAARAPGRRRSDCPTTPTTRSLVHHAAATSRRALGRQRRRARRRPPRRGCSATTASPSRPRRGELFVFDKLARPMVPHDRAAGAVLARQGRAGQPHHLRQRDARPDRRRTSTTAPPPAPPRTGFAFLLEKGRRLMPALLDEEVTATYAGLRAAIDARRLPDRPRPRRSATCSSAASARPASPRRWPSPSTSRRCSPTPGSTSTPRADLPDPPADAEPRRGRPPALPGRRPDRGRPGVRPHRLLLRAGDRGRDPRRVRLDHPARRPRRAAAPYPRHERPLPGLLLRRPGPRAPGTRRRSRRRRRRRDRRPARRAGPRRRHRRRARPG